MAGPIANAAVKGLLLMDDDDDDDLTAAHDVCDPLMRSLWYVGMGDTDAATTALWGEVAQMMADVMPTLERALVRYEPEDRARITKQWFENAFASAFPKDMRH
jgi:hypothetical protein